MGPCGLINASGFSSSLKGGVCCCLRFEFSVSSLYRVWLKFCWNSCSKVFFVGLTSSWSVNVCFGVVSRGASITCCDNAAAPWDVEVRQIFWFRAYSEYLVSTPQISEWFGVVCRCLKALETVARLIWFPSCMVTGATFLFAYLRAIFWRWPFPLWRLFLRLSLRECVFVAQVSD